MKLVVNGASVEVPFERPSVSQVLSHLGYRTEHAAIAVNYECVPRRDLECTVARENDEIEVLEPHQGG